MIKSPSAVHTAAWVFVAAISIWTALYFLQHFTTPSFQEGAMGNLFATILGVVVGIPIALEISRRQQASSQAAVASERLVETSVRKRKVLTLLRSELLSNRAKIVVTRGPIEHAKPREVSTAFLSDVLWIAFSDGGELRCVDDPDLLSRIAHAYHEIHSTIRLERLYMEALLFPGGKFSRAPENFYLESLTEKDMDLIQAVDMAVMAIDVQLPRLAAE
jgi:hypothetical protein